MKKDRCLFISYQRSDKVIVESIAHILERNGFHIWWDAFIPASSDWKDEIFSAIDRSGAFLAFVSNGIADSNWSIKEWEAAIRKRNELAKKGVEYPIVLVFLDKTSRSLFKDNELISEAINSFQYIPFWEGGGITERFIKNLFSVNWPDSLIRPEFADKVRKAAKGGSASTVGDVFVKEDIPFRSMHRFSEASQKSKREKNSPGFYKLEPGVKLGKDAVIVPVLDNQWLPSWIYDRNNPEYSDKNELTETFFKYGLGTCKENKLLTDKIKAAQRREIFRALLHNWQIVINRAYIYNTAAVREWYDIGSRPDKASAEELDAFHALVGDDSIIEYLWNEKYPAEEPEFNTVKKSVSAWHKFCMSCEEGKEISCLRFDWEDDFSNSAECSRLLAKRLQNFLLSLALDEDKKNIIATVYGISKDRMADFNDILGKVQSDVISFCNRSGKTYSRDRLYKRFLIKRGKLPNGEKITVADGVLAVKRKSSGDFIPALKQTVDLIYQSGLPSALGLRSIISMDSVADDFILDEDEGRWNREINCDVLTYAVKEFLGSLDGDAWVKALSQSSAFIDEGDYSLKMVSELRNTDEWNRYLFTLTDCRTRNRINELDFYHINTVFRKQHDLIDKAAKLYPDKATKKEPNAVSVIFTFEGLSVYVIVNGTEKIMILPKEEDIERLGIRKRKSRFLIDYVCGNVLSTIRYNPLMTRIRLFEGKTAGIEIVVHSHRVKGKDGKYSYDYSKEYINTYDSLVDCLKKLGFKNKTE